MSLIGRAQRRVVTKELDRIFHSGQRILELNCGTGVDALHLAGDIGVGVGLGDRLGAGAAHPAELALGRPRLREDGAAEVAPVELHQDRARIGVAAPHHHRRDRLEVAAADHRLDPKPRFQLGRHAPPRTGAAG